MFSSNVFLRIGVLAAAAGTFFVRGVAANIMERDAELARVSGLKLLSAKTSATTPDCVELSEGYLSANVSGANTVSFYPLETIG